MASRTNPALQETTELTIKVMPESGFTIRARVLPEGAAYGTEHDVAAVTNLAQLLGFLRNAYYGGQGEHHFEVYAPE